MVVSLDGMARTLVSVQVLETLVERGVDDSAASVNAFSNFVNAELTSPLCVDRVNLDVTKLTSLLYGRRSSVTGLQNRHDKFRAVGTGPADPAAAGPII